MPGPLPLGTMAGLPDTAPFAFGSIGLCPDRDLTYPIPL